MTLPTRIDEGFILNEDYAVKLRLTGITVSDDASNARPVNVWYGQPDRELREQNFPFMTIDLVDIQEGKDRAHRGIVAVDPDALADPTNTNPVQFTDFPIPVNLVYQIQSWSRHPRHDRQILRAMFNEVLPFKYGLLYVPGDGTQRSMWLTGYQKADRTDSNKKRLYRSLFTVVVVSELPMEKYTAVKKVTCVAGVKSTVV